MSKGGKSSGREFKRFVLEKQSKTQFNQIHKEVILHQGHINERLVVMWDFPLNMRLVRNNCLLFI